MTTILLTAGLACVIAAIIGGGLRAFGIEVPILQSGRRQLGLGLFGAALMVIAMVMNGGSGQQSSPQTAPTLGTAPKQHRR